MGYSKEKYSSSKAQRKIDDFVAKVFDGSDGIPKEMTEAARYLARLYLYAHGDSRSSKVLDSIAVSDTECVFASSTVPPFFRQYLELRNNELSHGLHIERRDSSTMVSVRVPEIVYPYADLSIEQDAVKVACFAIFQGLSMVVEPAARYQMNQQTMAWEHCDNRKPIIFVMDAIVGGRVTACPICGEPVYLKARKNPNQFCGIAHSNTYHRRAKKRLADGHSVNDVCIDYPLIKRDTIKAWAADLRRGLL